VGRLRLICVSALAALCVSASAFSALALGAGVHRHARAHRASRPRCGKAARARSKRAHGASRSKRRGHVSCLEHRAGRLEHSAGSSHSSAAGKRGSHRAPRSQSADDGGCTGASLQPSERNLEEIRAATLCLVNRERAAYGESPLQPNEQLQQAAQGHTESMVEQNYFEHIGPNGETPLQRMRAAGYIYNSQIGYEVGENIAWGTLWLGTPKAIVSAWMASPAHRANILDAHYRDTGIGVSPHPPSSLSGGQAGGIYTQDFGVIVGG
jgi:uncharacterized protein YkwD